MVNDAIAETRSRVMDAGVCDSGDIRAAGRPLAGFSPDLAAEERALKAFMYERLYYHPEQQATAARAREVVARLFAAIVETPSALPSSWRETLPEAEPQRSRHLADFVAGMTDRYAIQLYAKLFGEEPEGLRNV
jgi:dGTPase